MKIVLVNIFFYPDSFGGATVVVEENAKLLSKAGHEVIVISLTSRPEYVQNQIIKTSSNGVVNLQINSGPNSEEEKYLGSLDKSLLIAELIEDISPDILHVHCIQEIGINFLENIVSNGNLYKTKKILSIHDYWWLYKDQFLLSDDGQFTKSKIISESENLVMNKKAKKRSKSLSKALNLFDLITTPSEYSSELYKMNYSNLDFVTLPNGINLSSDDCTKTNSSKIIYGFLGGPGQVKGFENILRAVNQISLKRTEIRLVRAHESWYEDMDLPDEFKIVDRFTQKDIDKFYKKIDILLFPSQWGETFGLAIREALNRNKWVITTREGAQMEPIIENKNGNLIGLGDNSTEDLKNLFLKYDNETPLPKGNYNYSYQDQVNELIKIYEN